MNEDIKLSDCINRQRVLAEGKEYFPGIAATMVSVEELRTWEFMATRLEQFIAIDQVGSAQLDLFEIKPPNTQQEDA